VLRNGKDLHTSDELTVVGRQRRINGDVVESQTNVKQAVSKIHEFIHSKIILWFTKDKASLENRGLQRRGHNFIVIIQCIGTIRHMSLVNSTLRGCPPARKEAKNFLFATTLSTESTKIQSQQAHTTRFVLDTLDEEW
jgi:hypothetical protein